MSSMLKTYQSISPMLIKLESLVLGTSTGTSPAMQLLYEKYEKKIFAAFIMYVSFIIGENDNYIKISLLF